MSDHQNTPIVNPMPKSIFGLFMVIAAVEITFVLAQAQFIGGTTGIGWRSFAVSEYGLTSSLFPWMVENRYFPVEHLIRFLTYPFVHSGTMATAIACALFLGIGRMVGHVFSWWSVLVIFFGSAIFGGIAYSLFGPEGMWLFGSFPAVYGMIGAYTFMMWVTLRAEDGQSRQAFYLIAMLMGIQLVFEFLFSGQSEWIADLSGFLFGFFVCFLIAPGGFQRVVALVRRR